MIAKEDIKKSLDGLAQFIIMNDTGTDESASAIEWHNILTEALERAKKVEELLELYRKHYRNGIGYDHNGKLIHQIMNLEEEMK